MSVNFSNLQICEACRVLFPHAPIHHEFIHQLRLQSVKKSFRELAKRHHPDCIESADAPLDAGLFRRASQAYQLLCTYIRERDLIEAAKPQGRTVEVQQDNRPKQQQPVFRRRPRSVKPIRSPEDVYYEGPLPTFRLKLGLFLYYKGVVPYSSVVKALIWQRDMRPPIGDLAVAWGWLEPHFVSVIRSATELTGSFGEKAVELGLLSRSQIGVLLLHQRLMQAHVGRYFVAKGYLTEKELVRYMHEHTIFNEQRQPASGSSTAIP
jgi:hypothetical protein